MSYTVTNVTKNGSFDISQVVQSIAWGGDIRQAARKLEPDIVYSKDSYNPKYAPPLGSIIMLHDYGIELFRGVVFDVTKSTGGTLKVVAYDHLIYLLNSKGTYIFRGMTADAIISKLCGDFGVPVGSVPATGIVLDKLILRDMSIYDMCLVALTETTKRNSKKYQLKMKNGALHVIEKGQQVLKWLITEGQNLISAEYSESINEMKNRIVIVGDKDQVLAEVKDDALIQQYGMLQELKNEGNITTGEAQTIASNMLKDLGKVTQEASVECLGLDEVEAGAALEVKETLTGLVGTYYVETDDHTVKNNLHTMNLKLAWTDEVATKDAPEVKE